MSILIRGMEMPTSRPICVVIDAAGQARRYDLNNDRYADNELLETISVPPHGRLVDMGEIEERIDSCCDDIDCSKTMCNECAVQIVMNKVFDAPTIIPASEEGET